MYIFYSIRIYVEKLLVVVLRPKRKLEFAAVKLANRGPYLKVSYLYLLFSQV